MKSRCPQDMAHLECGMGGHRFCWVIQGPRQAADTERASPAGGGQNGDCGPLAQVMAALTWGPRMGSMLAWQPQRHPSLLLGSLLMLTLLLFGLQVQLLSPFPA